MNADFINIPDKKTAFEIIKNMNIPTSKKTKLRKQWKQKYDNVHTETKINRLKKQISNLQHELDDWLQTGNVSINICSTCGNNIEEEDNIKQSLCNVCIFHIKTQESSFSSSDSSSF